MKKKLVTAAVSLIFISFLILFLIWHFYNADLAMKKTIETAEKVHEHADFKVYLDGKEYNFSRAKYMSDETKVLSQLIHLHDMDGEIIHKHANGVALGQFFESIGMKFNNTCFILDNKAQYCNRNNKTLKMYVNGILNNDFGNYELKDLDKILISYGNDDEKQIRKQIGSVTDKACIQSEKCPERGLPTPEASCSSNEICTVG